MLFGSWLSVRTKMLLGSNSKWLLGLLVLFRSYKPGSQSGSRNYSEPRPNLCITGHMPSRWVLLLSSIRGAAV